MRDDRNEVQGRGIEAGAAARVAIRPATAGDLDRIWAIERASFSDPWSRQSFDRLLGDDRVHFMVAEPVAGPPVGYVVAWYVMSEGEIANLAVAAEARHVGVGGALLDSALAAARERGATDVYLEVRDSNAGARALYASRGFQQIARRRRYYRRPTEDALVLHLAFPAS